MHSQSIWKDRDTGAHDADVYLLFLLCHNSDFLFIFWLTPPTCTASTHTAASSIYGVFLLAGVRSSWKTFEEKGQLQPSWLSGRGTHQLCKVPQLLGISSPLTSISSAERPVQEELWFSCLSEEMGSSLIVFLLGWFFPPPQTPANLGCKMCCWLWFPLNNCFVCVACDVFLSL